MLRTNRLTPFLLGYRLYVAVFFLFLDAPLVAGCIGWLECRLIPEPHIQQAHDLFIGEAVAAWVDERAFEGGKFRPLDDTPPAWRTLHHLGAGNFVVPGAQLKARAQTSG